LAPLDNASALALARSKSAEASSISTAACRSNTTDADGGTTEVVSPTRLRCGPLVPSRTSPPACTA
jgi:hypothetical protein